MKCPVCSSIDLVMAERQGIEIDYCPACRGVWLDRGELDKILERSAQQGYGTGPGRRETPPAYPPPRHEGDHRHGYRQHKKKSFLSEIFDFD